MDFDSNMINQIIAIIKDNFSKHQSSNMGHEYGLTFNEILNDVNATFVQIYPDLPPIQPNQLQQILKYQINGVNQFDTIIRNDGTVLYQVSQQIDTYNQYLFEYPSIFSTDPPPTHFVAPHLQTSQIPQQFIQPIHQQISSNNSVHPQSHPPPPPPPPPRGPPFSQQIPLHLQLQLHPTPISAPGPIQNIPIQNDQQQQFQFQQHQIQFQPPPPPQQYMPTTVEELTKEIHKEQKRIDELKKRQDHLMICNQLLQNPAQLKAVVKKMEQTVLYLKNMQSMVDDKIKDLVSYLDFVLDDK